MSVPRERYLEGATWEDWIERLGEEGWIWEERFRQARLGRHRAAFQEVPTPRYVLCLFDPESTEGYESVPLIAKACDQAGSAGGVELRLFPYGESQDIARQYLTGERRALPLCVVFDDSWVQTGLFQPTPRTASAAEWQDQILLGLLAALRGQPVTPLEAGQEPSMRRWGETRQGG